MDSSLSPFHSKYIFFFSSLGHFSDTWMHNWEECNLQMQNFHIYSVTYGAITIMIQKVKWNPVKLHPAAKRVSHNSSYWNDRDKCYSQTIKGCTCGGLLYSSIISAVCLTKLNKWKQTMGGYYKLLKKFHWQLLCPMWYLYKNNQHSLWYLACSY